MQSYRRKADGWDRMWCALDFRDRAEIQRLIEQLFSLALPPHLYGGHIKGRMIELGEKGNIISAHTISLGLLWSRRGRGHFLTPGSSGCRMVNKFFQDSSNQTGLCHIGCYCTSWRATAIGVMDLGDINKENQKNKRGWSKMWGEGDRDGGGTKSQAAEPCTGKKGHMPVPECVFLFPFGIPRHAWRIF